MGRKSLFNNAWLGYEVDEIPVSSWCVADPSNNLKAKCLKCRPGVSQPFGLTFSIREGFTAIKKHARATKHIKYAQGDNEGHAIEGVEQIDIEAAFKNQEELNKQTISENKRLLEGQILFSNLVHSHGIPSSFFTCFGDLASRIFPDSKLAKRWSSSKDGMRQTKGDYFLTHGIYEYHHQKLVESLRNAFFSVNIDESSVNKKSQLNVNISYIDKEKRDCRKQNFTTISMEKGTSAAEIVDALVKEFDESFIPLTNIVTIVTDGCSTMLGEEGGVHALLRQRLPHLPRWGGCSCHDCSNILKAGVAKLNSNLTSLYSQLHTYLSTS